MRRLLTAACLCALAAAVTAADSDWPTFRGADRADVSKDTGLLKKWTDGGPPLAWKAEGLGVGYSSVSVMGDKVFNWGPHDIFVVPSWVKHTHEASDEAVLFSYSDRGVQEKLDFFREQKFSA